ncbi:hypothetical protein TTHERM_000575489 (macronuclear) [Tetrahymena thermophila SB210]|uniref:Kinase domain protein n=1 Tax=Tetrahymena thermophila (strain SB210) TaxID=312017 RepID=W7XJP3_TETTS|nr:hypothetical protein TTHERM_000575489 [Tetrahymena thermophila SB210]EWS75746.1 hypothetical protein TTHERM_000575489 [Tetrahymena thermophila SB210]|eukprot:XP_012651668.1 hypothetical protein TTHERM_000575489 [Tetrahymena thermophila SB210]
MIVLNQPQQILIRDQDNNVKGIKIILNNLMLDENQIIENFIKISNYKKLDQLIIKLSNNLAKQKSAQFIFQFISQISNLSYLELDLYQNKLDINTGVSFPTNELCKWTNLTTLILDLGTNKIGSSGIKTICQELLSLQNLINLSLNVCKNEIQNNGSADLGSAISSMTKIENLHLNIGDNQIDNQGITVLLNSIQSCQTIKKLQLEAIENKIDGIGAINIGISVSSLSNLNRLILNLNNNRIDTVGFNTMLQKISTSVSIQQIILLLLQNQASYMDNCGQTLRNFKQLNYAYIQLNKIGHQRQNFKIQHIKKCKKLIDFSLL